MKELARRLGVTLSWVGACWCCWACCKPVAAFTPPLLPSSKDNPWREGGNYPRCFRQLQKCPPQARQCQPWLQARAGRRQRAPAPHQCVWAGLHRPPLSSHWAGLTNTSALLMTRRDCGDMGRVRQTDGQQLLRIAVLAAALKMFLAAPLSSQSRSPGLTLMAEFVGAAVSWFLVKTFIFVA